MTDPSTSPEMADPLAPQPSPLWLESFSRAVVAGDAAQADRLAAALPVEWAAPIVERLRRAVTCLQHNDIVEAFAELTADSGAVGQALSSAGLSDDITSDDALREAVATGLQALWLEAAASGKAAASAYFEAGKRCSNAGERGRSLSAELLERCISLDSLNQLAHWYLAYVLMVLSYRPRPPYADRARVMRGLEVWNAGAALHSSDTAASWELITRAQLNEQLARLESERQIPILWEAVWYVERALLLNDAEVGNWSALARLNRMLGKEANALHAAGKAIALVPDDLSALEEHAAILANIGAFADALAAIDRRLETEPENTWALGVRAYILAHQKNYPQALALIDAVVVKEPETLWDLDLKAQCHQRLGDAVLARDTYERIWTSRATAGASSDEQRIVAQAAYKLGLPQEAIVIYERVLQRAGEGESSLASLGFCYLAVGNLVRGEELILRSLVRMNLRELDDFNDELLDLLAIYPDVRRIPGAAATTAYLERTTAALLEQRRARTDDDRRAAAVAELELVLQSVGLDAEVFVGSAPRLSLARLRLEGAEWHAATLAYRALSDEGPELVETMIGIGRAATGLRSLAVQSVAERAFGDAVDAYRLLLELSTPKMSTEDAPMIRCALGDALWNDGDESTALEEFERALEDGGARTAGPLLARIALAHQETRIDTARRTFAAAFDWFRRQRTTSPGRQLADAVRPLVRDIAHFWSVDSRWREFERDGVLGPADAGDLAVARAALLSWVDTLLGVNERRNEFRTGITVPSIILEVGNDLVPLVDPQTDSDKFIAEQIPAMRSRIETSMGLRIPGVQVRKNSTPDAAYTILVHGTPAASGAVCAGRRFGVVSHEILLEHGVAGDDIDESVLPSTGERGFWFQQSHWPSLSAGGVRLLSETGFILLHLEVVLRRNLHRLIGFDEMVALMASLPTDVRLTGFADWVLSDVNRQFELISILRELVRDDIPIADWTGIADGMRDAQADGLADVMRMVPDRVVIATAESAGAIPLADSHGQAR